MYEGGEPGGGRGDRGVRAARLPADVEGLVAQAVSFVEQQQVELAQRLARDPLPPAQPVVQRCDQDEVLVEQRQFDDSGHAEGDGEQQQVEPARGEPLQQARRLFLVDLEVEGRIAVVDEPQDGRQQIGRHRRDHPEAQHPGEGRPNRLGLVHQGAHLVEHGLRPDGQPLAGR